MILVKHVDRASQRGIAAPSSGMRRKRAWVFEVQNPGIPCRWGKCHDQMWVNVPYRLSGNKWLATHIIATTPKKGNQSTWYIQQVIWANYYKFLNIPKPELFRAFWGRAPSLKLTVTFHHHFPGWIPIPAAPHYGIVRQKQLTSNKHGVKTSCCKLTLQII